MQQPKQQKKRLDEIITLYADRKISNITTAENLIKGLTSSNKKTYDKAFQKYKDNIKEFKEKKPLNERLKEARDKTYFISFLLYTTREPKSEKLKPAFKRGGRTYYLLDANTDQRVKNVSVKLQKAFPTESINQQVVRYETKQDESNENENKEFWTLLDILRKDEDFNDLVVHLLQFYDNLFEAIKIKSVELVNKKGEKFNVMTENLRDATNISLYHRYINTPINIEASTIKMAIEKGNHIKNACWANALYDFYGNTIMSEKTRKRLTIERMIEITGRQDFYENGLSINDMDKVFKEFKIPARIYNFFNKLLYKYTPPNQNWHIKPFYAIVKSSHIYVMNHDLKSIQQKQDDHIIPTVQASTDYYINEREEPPQYKMINDSNDILKFYDDKEYFLVSRLNNLNKLFFDLVCNGYEPRIKFQAGKITVTRIQLNGTKYTIKTQNLIKDSHDGCITVSSEDTYNKMNKAMFDFNKALCNPIHKSFYSDIDIKILNEARTVVALGKLCDKIDKALLNDIIEIDVSKAFTHAFLQIDEVPVFNQFDTWNIYNKETHDFRNLHKLTLYYVKNNNCMNKNKILLNKDYCLLYGVFLQQISLRGIDILYFKEPSQIHKCNYKELTKELWNNKISHDEDEDKQIKKLIANVNYGLLEKGGSTDQKSIPFKDLKEAMDYQTEYGGRLCKIEEEIDEADETGQCKTYASDRTPCYILNLRDKAELKNGFRWIKELLLQHHNFKMYNDYCSLTSSVFIGELLMQRREMGLNTDFETLKKLQKEKEGVQIFSVKTDAFTILKSDLSKAMERINFYDGIGGWRVSKGQEVLIPSMKYNVVENEVVEVPTRGNKEIKIVDEYKTDDIIKKIVDVKQVMIRGLIPGTGKSYICQKMTNKGYKVLFVCPTNRLLQEFEGDAITINKFFGISFGNVKLEKFDYSGYDVIVFDEIYFSGLSVYWKIKRFVEENKDKIIVATGDTKQLKAIQQLTNTQDYEKYVDKIIDNIFEYNILLKECKRLNTQEDKDKLFNIKEDIFINKLPINKLIKKYFRYTDDIASSKYNIAFLNTTCKNVSNEIRKLENRKDEYECGETLICREYTKIKSHAFNVNFKYDIVKVIDGILLLKNVKSGKISPLPIEKARKAFIFAWCSTCHSAQGSSVDEEITIFDYNHFLVKDYPEWIYTALTRCRDLNKVKFFRYKNDKDDEFNKQNIISYFERKIEAYKTQDRTAKRSIPKVGYVNVEWFIDNIRNQCNYCGCGFHLDIRNGNIMSNLTCQRVNNELTHTLENIVPYCCRCNCSCK